MYINDDTKEVQPSAASIVDYTAMQGYRAYRRTDNKAEAGSIGRNIQDIYSQNRTRGNRG